MDGSFDVGGRWRVPCGEQDHEPRNTAGPLTSVRSTSRPTSTPTPRFGRSGRARWLLVLLTVALLAASCTDSDSDPSADGSNDDSGSSSESGTSTTLAPEIASGGTGTVQGTPLSVDPEVRIGRLDNGLTYYVRSNDSPGSQLQLRLVVRAGSLQEQDELSGIAHFTEHMMFNGTESFPKNTLNEVLRSFGTEFGADLNAYTSYDETVYLLSVPRTDDDAVAAAFGVLDEWAERAIISEQDTIEERGVVREEFRTRAESVDGVIFDSFDALYTENSSYTNRTPIGSQAAIDATTSDQIRSFYDRWYRPEYMAVVAVGDLPVERLEEEVVAFFADNSGRGEAGEWSAPDAPSLTEAHVEVLTHPEGPEPFVSLDYSLPNREGGTVEGERGLLLDEVLAALIQQRLDEGAARGELPVVRPSVSNFDYTRARRFLGFNFLAEDEAAGLTAVLNELAGIESNGFTDAEVQLVVEQFRGAVDQMRDTVGTRQDTEYASDYVEHFLAGFAIESVDAAHERLQAELDAIDGVAVSEHAAEVLASAAPLVIVVGSDAAVLPTEAELTAALGAVDAANASGSGEIGDVELPAAPAAVAAVAERRNSDLDATVYEFANGVQVVFRPSEIAEGQVDLIAQGDGGWSTLELGQGPLATVAAQAVSLSGVGDLDSVDLDRALAGTVVSLNPYIDELTEGFVGSSSADDVELLFQLLHLAVVSPRVDAGPFAEAVETARGQIRASETDPAFASLLTLLDARYGGDPWQDLLPTRTQLDGFTASEALDLYRTRLGSVDDMVIAVVGDVDAAQIESLAATYLGTLPGGEPDTWVDRSPAPPESVVTRTVSAGTNDSGAGFDLLVSTELRASNALEVALPVLQSVVQDRLVDQLREALGASYGGGQVVMEVVDEPDALIEVFVSVSGDPDRVDEMHAITLGVLSDLADNGPSSTEFEEAASVVRSNLEFVNNFSLLGELLDWSDDGAGALLLADAYRATVELEADDVAAAAQAVLDVDRRVEVFRRP